MMMIEDNTMEDEMIELYEQLLFERAANGARPVLYVSSSKDLECAVAMLLEQSPDYTFSRMLEAVSERMVPQPLAN